MTRSNSSSVPIAKSILDKYLKRKRGQKPLSEEDPVYNAVLYSLQNPGAQYNVAERYSLTPEQGRMVRYIAIGTRNYQKKVSKSGSIY